MAESARLALAEAFSGNAQLTVTNNTLSGNMASGNGGEGGGSANDREATIADTILKAGGATGGTIANSGTVTSVGYNLPAMTAAAF